MSAVGRTQEVLLQGINMVWWTYPPPKAGCLWSPAPFAGTSPPCAPSRPAAASGTSGRLSYTVSPHSQTGGGCCYSHSRSPATGLVAVKTRGPGPGPGFLRRKTSCFAWWSAWGSAWGQVGVKTGHQGHHYCLQSPVGEGGSWTGWRCWPWLSSRTVWHDCCGGQGGCCGCLNLFLVSRSCCWSHWAWNKERNKQKEQLINSLATLMRTSWQNKHLCSAPKCAESQPNKGWINSQNQAASGFYIYL